MNLWAMVVAALACAAMLVSGALRVTLAASLGQAAADVALSFVLFVAWRIVYVTARRIVYARDRAADDARDAKRWREAEEKRWERVAARRRPRRRSR